MIVRLGRYAVESYLEQILSHGFFHADPVSHSQSYFVEVSLRFRFSVLLANVEYLCN